MAEKKELKESKFIELKIPQQQRVDVQSIPTEGEFQAFYGDRVATRLVDADLQQDAASVFSERYAEEIPSDEVTEQKIVENMDKVFKSKKLGSMEKGKRIGRAKEKIRLQRHLKKEQNLYSARSKKEKQYLEKKISKENIEDVNRIYTTDAEKEAIKQWAVGYEVREGEVEIGYHSALFGGKKEADERTRLSEMVFLVQDLPTIIKPENFAYEDDADFVSNFAEKYDLLCKGASAAAFVQILENIEKEGRTLQQASGGRNCSIIEGKSMVELCVKLKEQYEQRMELIRSPYYALLDEEDIEGYQGEKGFKKLGKDVKSGNEEFIQYVQRYQWVKKNMLNGKKDLKATYNARVKELQKQYSDRDVAKMKQSGYNLSETAEQNIQRLYQRAYKKHDEDNKDKQPLDYLKNVEFETEVMSDSLDQGDIKALEKLLIEICEHSTMNGVRLQDEDVQDVSNWVQEVFDLRRAATAGRLGCEAANNFQNLGVDIINPGFKKTKYAKLFEQMEDYDLSDMTNQMNAKINEYMGKVEAKMVELAQKGYAVVPKYENKMNSEEEVDKAVEDVRRRNEEDYNVNHPNAPVVGWQFEKITFNGREFNSYDYKGDVLEVLIGKNIQVNEADVNVGEVWDILTRIQNITKTQVAANEIFQSGGVKRIPHLKYQQQFDAERKRLLARLVELLKDSLPEIATWEPPKQVNLYDDPALYE